MERLLRLRSELWAWLAKLSPRERVMVSAAAVAVFVFDNDHPSVGMNAPQPEAAPGIGFACRSRRSIAHRQEVRQCTELARRRSAT